MSEKLKEQLEQLMTEAYGLFGEPQKCIDAYKKAINLMDNNPEIKTDYYYLYAYYMLMKAHPHLGEFPEEKYDTLTVKYAKKCLDILNPIFSSWYFTQERQFHEEVLRSSCNAIAWHSLPTTETQEGLEELLTHINRGCEYANEPKYVHLYDAKVSVLTKMGRKEEAFKLVGEIKQKNNGYTIFSGIDKTNEYKQWLENLKGDETQEREDYIKSLKNADGNDVDYPFERLKKGMYNFSKAVSKKENKNFENEFDSFISTTDVDIIKLEKKIGIPLPKELKAFYKKIGGLHNNRYECFSIIIDFPSVLINAPYEEVEDENGEVKHSLGIIDSIIVNLGNYCPELQNLEECSDPEEYKEYEDDRLEDEETKYLNENFKCIGTWTDSDGEEASFYLIFDKLGNFDYIYYRDCFKDVIVSFRELIKNGLKSNSLEDVLSDALETLAEEY